MSKINNILLGSDPEFFLFSQKENKFISAIGTNNGTKDNPEPITDQGHFIQVDGSSIEFNIPPVNNSDNWIKELSFVTGYIKDTIATPKGLIISNAATAMFTDDQLDCPEAWEIGCCPDITCWTMEVNHPQGYYSNLRASGGHISVGYDKSNEKTSLELIRAMDLYLGVPSILLDKDTLRRELYGKAGAFRFKEWGLEYRTLSNFWLFNKELMKWAFDNTIKACEFVNYGGEITNPRDIINCINNGDKELAMEIIEDYHIDIPEFNKEYINEFV